MSRWPGGRRSNRTNLSSDKTQTKTARNHILFLKARSGSNFPSFCLLNAWGVAFASNSSHCTQRLRKAIPKIPGLHPRSGMQDENKDPHGVVAPLDHPHTPTYSSPLLSDQSNYAKTEGEKNRSALLSTKLFPPRHRDNQGSSCVVCHRDFPGILWSWYHLYAIIYNISLAWPLSIHAPGLRELQLSSKTVLCCVFWLEGMIKSECQNVLRGWGINSREMNVVRHAII